MSVSATRLPSEVEISDAGAVRVDLTFGYAFSSTSVGFLSASSVSGALSVPGDRAQIIADTIVNEVNIGTAPPRFGNFSSADEVSGSGTAGQSIFNPFCIACISANSTYSETATFSYNFTQLTGSVLARNLDTGTGKKEDFSFDLTAPSSPDVALDLSELGTWDVSLDSLVLKGTASMFVRGTLSTQFALDVVGVPADTTRVTGGPFQTAGSFGNTLLNFKRGASSNQTSSFINVVEDQPPMEPVPLPASAWFLLVGLALLVRKGRAT